MGQPNARDLPWWAWDWLDDVANSEPVSNALVRFAGKALRFGLDRQARRLVIRPGPFATWLGSTDRLVRKQLDALADRGLLDLRRDASRTNPAVYGLVRTMPTPERGVPVSGAESGRSNTPTPARGVPPSDADTGTPRTVVAARGVPVSDVGSRAQSPADPHMSAHTGTPRSGVGAVPKTSALPDHQPTARAVRPSSGSSSLSLAVNGTTQPGWAPGPERETPPPLDHHKPAGALTLLDLVRTAEPGMTSIEAEAVITAARASRRIDSLTAWAGSVRGQDDIRDRLATHRATRRPLQPAAAACPVCVAGWIGEDDDDRPIPCPACKPHAARTR